MKISFRTSARWISAGLLALATQTPGLLLAESSQPASPVTADTVKPDQAPPAASPAPPAAQGSHNLGPGGLPMTTPISRPEGPADPRTSSVGPTPIADLSRPSTPPPDPGYLINPGTPYKPPPSHVAAEPLARGFGYEGGRPQSDKDDRNADLLSIRGDSTFRQHLTDKGYTLVDAIDNRDTGLQASVVRDNNGKTTIIFRGTEPTAERGADLFADAHANVGIGQYDGDKDKLDQWAQQYPGATVTGHSLGAALGEHFIADHPGSVTEGILFNTPGVSQDDVDKYNRSDKKPPITMYQSSGDFVSEMGGTTHLPATVVIAHGGQVDSGTGWFLPDDPNNVALPYHRGTMLQNDSGTSLNTIPFDQYEQGRFPTSEYGEPIENFLEGVKIAEDTAGQGLSDFWHWLVNRGEAPPQVLNGPTTADNMPTDSPPTRDTIRPPSTQDSTIPDTTRSVAGDNCKPPRPPRCNDGDGGRGMRGGH